MFDSVRQIVESRLLSVRGSSYDTEIDDTFSSILTKNPIIGNIDNLIAINPTIVTTDNDLLITFGSNNNGTNAAINISGFPGEFLFTGVSAGLVLALHNENGSGALVNQSGDFVVIRNDNAAASIDNKIASWVNIINATSSLGLTARVGVQNTPSIVLVPKDRADTFARDSLSITRNQFSVSIDYTIIPPLTWVTSVRFFPLFLEGRMYTQPTNEQFAVLMIQDAASVAREFSNVKNARRHSGTVRLKLYAPHGNGTKIVRDMADLLDTVLSYTAGDSGTNAGGTLFMKTGSLSQVSENTDGFLEYNLDYIYDYYTS